MISVKTLLSRILPSSLCRVQSAGLESKRIFGVGLICMSLSHRYAAGLEEGNKAFRLLLRKTIAENSEFTNAGFKEEDIYKFLGLSKAQYDSNVSLTKDQELHIHLGNYLLFGIRSSKKDEFELEKLTLEDLLRYANESKESEISKEIKIQILNLTREDFDGKLDRLKKLVKQQQ